MARAHRVSLIATIATVSYLLLLFNVFPLPLVDAKIAEQIVPVVRNLLSLILYPSLEVLLSVHSIKTEF